MLIMNASQTTNNNAQSSKEPGANERTPLLKDRCEGRTIASEDSSVTETDEEAQCLSESADKDFEGGKSRNIGGVISILLLGTVSPQSFATLDLPVLQGVFLANTDGSLVLATSGTISSEFNDLNNAGWLISSYTLAMCATQSLVS